MKKIAIISTIEKGVGLSSVSNLIIDALKDHYQVFLFAMDQEGDVYTRAEGGTIIPCFCNGSLLHQQNFLMSGFRALQPALFLWYFDLFPLNYFSTLFAYSKRLGIKRTIYIPVDGDLVDLGQIAVVLEFDRLIFFSKSIKDQFDAVLEKANCGVLPECTVIGHSVETFWSSGPVKDQTLAEYRVAARRAFFKKGNNYEDSFIVLNANRNWARKRLDLTIEGFSKFSKMAPNAVLFLHLPHATLKERLFFKSEVLRLGIEGRVIMPNDETILPLKDLKLLYQSCDVGINTSMGEGWGLASNEHGLTTAAQIVPGFSNQKEIWGDAAVFLELVESTYQWSHPHLEYRSTTPTDICKNLLMLYTDERALISYSVKARKRMLMEKFRLEFVNQEWVNLFESIIK
ncbi:glycosyltransferase family 4 protein [Neolewinella lacunae]|uniref:Glycosyltransferase family 4 protein n=1 Tax=Neolewinella lacunae TaxID=1517758 RepID=A0A923PL96_9BACT|nr:glycosyltransferase family 4 protein [Neolewinella lacunae]MBC6993364.1 glycosyltransferase family 4 protein [Neolewinella lacunae]MDN3636354.1 glycosyltransferase family 4 protein [Neolewinella lacunae]